MNKLTPNLIVDSIESCLEFWSGRLGFEQVTEFAEFDRPRRVTVHVVEGPYPVDGTWTFAPAAGGTEVRFVAEGELTGLLGRLGPLARMLMSRQFAGYHRRLRENLEGGGR